MKVLVIIFLSFLLFTHALRAQFSIRGTITDQSSGQPLTGANIRVEGTYLGCISDIQGTFVLNDLPPGEHILRITFIGYQDFSQSVSLTDDIKLDVVLVPGTLLGEEVTIRSTRLLPGFSATAEQVDRAQIQRRNTGKDIPFLMSITPSVTTTSDAGNDIGYSSLRIRGTDMSRINVTINGIPYNDPESQSVFWVDIPDFASSLNNVQVQRGVGTSTNGAAAFGASMNFQTQTLNSEPYGEIEAAGGSFNTFKAKVAAGTGLIKNKFAFDARLSRLSSDGYIDRASSLLKSYHLSGGYYSRNTTIRINLFSGYEKTYMAWEGVPGDSLETNRTFNPAGMYADSNGVIHFYDNQTDNYWQDHYQVLISRQVGKKLILNATSFLVKGKGYYESYKDDESLEDYGNGFLTAGPGITETDLINQKWLDNAFAGMTFSALYNPSRKLDVRAGGSFQLYTGDHFGYVIWASDALFAGIDLPWYKNQGKKNEGNVYFKADYRLSDRWSLFGDLQFRAVSYRLSGTDDNLRSIDLDKLFRFFNPKFGGTFLVNTNQSVYTMFGIAHREPSRRNYLDADPGREPRPETLYDLEAGYTIRYNKIALNLNGYAMFYHDQLVLTGEINNIGDPIMVNVPESYRVGLEIESSALLWKKLTWEINLTLSRNKIRDFTEYVDNWDTGNQHSQPLGMTNLSFSPELILHNHFTYEPLLGLRISLLSNLISRQYIDNTSNKGRSLDPYFVNNLSINYTIPVRFLREFSIDFMLYNLTNTKYETDAWVYRYIYEGSEQSLTGYFPQATLHFLTGLRIGF